MKKILTCVSVAMIMSVSSLYAAAPNLKMSFYTKNADGTKTMITFQEAKNKANKGEDVYWMSFQGAEQKLTKNSQILTTGQMPK
jgi:hypothetical protein